MGGDYNAAYKLKIRKPDPSRRVRPWLLLVLLGVPLLLIYLCIRSVRRLAPEPPAEFFEARPEWNAETRKAEQRLALAYWKMAATKVQWDYPYGSALPKQPPPKFQIDVSQIIGQATVPPDSGERYWQRLRNVWSLTPSWRESYEWNTGWLTRIFWFIPRERRMAQTRQLTGCLMSAIREA